MKNTERKIRICSVVTGETLEKFLINLEKIQRTADMVELRVDYIQDMKVEYLDVIKKVLTKESIFTCRSKSDYGRGNFVGGFGEVTKLYQYANIIGFDYVDIEYREYDKIEIKNMTSKLILSYHNWRETFSYEKLDELLNAMREKKHDILKIATMVHTDEDSKNLIKLLLNKDPDEKLIVIGMGEKAKFTRTFNPLLGSFLTFASVGDSYSAPGQLDVKTLKSIYTKLGYTI